jgi:hypothetical protein
MFHTQNNPGREDEEEDDEGEDEEEKPSSRNAVPRVSAHA